MNVEIIEDTLDMLSGRSKSVYRVNIEGMFSIIENEKDLEKLLKNIYILAYAKGKKEHEKECYKCLVDGLL